MSDNDRSGGRLSGVDKKEYLHICRFKNEGTDIDDNIMNYITNDVDTDTVECEKYKTYYGNHVYFKLGVLQKDFDKLYKADYWPRGVEIKTYFFRYHREQQSSNTNQQMHNSSASSK